MQVKPQSAVGSVLMVFIALSSRADETTRCRVCGRGNGRLEQSMQGIGHCDTSADSPQGEPWQGCICVLATIGVCLAH